MMRLAHFESRRLGGRLPLMALLGVGLMLAGCLPAAGPAQQPGTGPGNAPATGPKALRMGVLARLQPKESLIAFSTNSGSGESEYMYMFHAGLTAYDPQSTILPRIAQKVPTASDGDWKVFPDGQMEVTWKLRSGVKWHDGVPATAADFALGLRAIQDPDFPLTRSDAARLISEIATPDDSTLVVRWKQTFIYANASGPNDIFALPRHLMGDLYEKGDKQAFFNSPQWTREFVGLGPFRLGEWVEGSQMEGLAFDDYFLGRPKIDRVILQYLGDSNVLLVNLLSGAIDMAPMGNFQIPQLVEVKRAWEATGAGTTFLVPARTRTYSFQFRDPDAPWARDARVRRALVHMLDRQALVETLMGGLVGVADTLVVTEDPAYRLLEQRGLPRYPFDLGQAERLMAAAGWTRDSGAYRSSAGQPFVMDIVFSDSIENSQEATAVAGQWKAAGLADVTISGIPTTLPTAVRNQARHAGKGVAAFPTGTDLVAIGGAFTTAEIGGPENRWTGGNRGGYSNPAFDRLYERASITLDDNQRSSLVADMLKILAEDVGTIVGFYDSSLATGAFRQGIRGPGPTSGLQLVGATWNIHEWEMD